MKFQKGQVANPKGRPKGALGMETLTKLERRAYFDKRAAEKFDEWIDKCKPEYGLEQFLGKVKDELEVIIKKTPSPRLQELADKLVELQKKRGTGNS
jgi:hypothetical protein